VWYSDEQAIVFEDKFGVSDVHLDVIPTHVVEDITHLTKDDIPLVKRTATHRVSLSLLDCLP
jgi:diadenosine tetraphosphate (Ap4A) HIT family hydrolase